MSLGQKPFFYGEAELCESGKNLVNFLKTVTIEYKWTYDLKDAILPFDDLVCNSFGETDLTPLSVGHQMFNTKNRDNLGKVYAN